MKLSELQRKLEDLAIKAGPDHDPDVVILAEGQWGRVSKAEEGNYSTDGITGAKIIIIS